MRTITGWRPASEKPLRLDRRGPPFRHECNDGVSELAGRSETPPTLFRVSRYRDAFHAYGPEAACSDWSAYTSSDRLPSFAQIIRMIWSGRIPGQVVREEFGRQLDSFTKAFGSLPAYIDGHHHVHQLPIIREIVVSSVSAVQGSNPIFVRNCYVRPQLALQRGVTPLKAIGLAVPGRGMVTWLKRYGLWTNSDFSGVYDLSGKASYESLFERFLVGAKSAITNYVSSVTEL